MAHKNKIVDTLSQWEDLKTELSAETWERMVLPGAAFFTSVLAMDIVHDDLTASECAGLETTLDTVAEWYWQAPVRAWPAHVPAVRGVWALYRADRPPTRVRQPTRG